MVVVVVDGEVVAVVVEVVVEVEEAVEVVEVVFSRTLLFRYVHHKSLINSFSPELPSRPIDDTVKFIFNREI